MGEQEGDHLPDLDRVPTRASGCRAAICACTSSWSPRYSSQRAVETDLSATLSVQVRAEPWSTATARVSPSTAVSPAA